MCLTLSACGASQADADRAAAQAAALLDQRRIAEARLAIGEAISDRGDEPQYYLLRGRIEMAAGSPEGAFNAYQDALALEGTNSEALQGVAQLGLQIGRLDEAQKAAEQILSIDPQQKDALLVSGLIAFVKRRYDDALDYADRVLSQNPLDEGGTILRARAAFLRGDDATARRTIAAYTSKATATAGTSRTMLEIARSSHDAPAMRKSFLELRKLVPNDPGLAIDEGDFLFKSGNHTDAIALTAKLLADAKASSADAQDVLRLWREYAVGAPKSEIVQSVVSSGSPANRLALARYLMDAGALSAAASALSGLDTPAARAVAARLALAGGDTGAALRQADRVLARDGNECVALNTKGAALLKTNAANDAIRFAQQATAQCPDDIQGWVTTALAYSSQDDAINARRVFRDGLAANPQNSRLAMIYADWLIGQHADREAVATARRLTRASPALTSGWRLYANVCQRTGAGCAGDAAEGLAKSRTLYGVDLKPGTLPPYGLFGRFVIR